MNESSRCEGITEKFRQQAMDKEEALVMVREQYVATQQLYQRKIQALEDKHATLSRKYRALERRRALEIAGAAASTLHR
jgi:hypothetical protein